MKVIEIKEIIKDILRYGFSALLAIAGVVLIYLGIGGVEKCEPYWVSGIIVIGFSILFYIGEITYKIFKLTKKTQKSLNKDN